MGGHRNFIHGADSRTTSKEGGRKLLPWQRRLPSNNAKIMGFITSLTTYCSITHI